MMSKFAKNEDASVALSFNKFFGYDSEILTETVVWRRFGNF